MVTYQEVNGAMADNADPDQSEIRAVLLLDFCLNIT